MPFGRVFGFSIVVGVVAGCATPHPSPRDPALSTSAVFKMPLVDAGACAQSVSYPPSAMEMGMEGVVKLELHLDTEGRVARTRILHSAGRILDGVALDAIQHHPACRFGPARDSAGRAIEIDIPYVFQFLVPR